MEENLNFSNKELLELLKVNIAEIGKASSLKISTPSQAARVRTKNLEIAKKLVLYSQKLVEFWEKRLEGSQQ